MQASNLRKPKSHLRSKLESKIFHCFQKKKYKFIKKIVEFKFTKLFNYENIYSYMNKREQLSNS